MVGLNDFKLLAYGRHFRIAPGRRLVIGRFKGENEPLEKLCTDEDLRFEMAGMTGPTGLGRGVFSRDDIRKAAALLARYSRARELTQAEVRVTVNGAAETVVVRPATDDECNAFR